MLTAFRFLCAVQRVMSSRSAVPSLPPHCPLCQPLTAVVWADARLAVVAVDDAAYPGYTRVIWQRHQAEMTDLSRAERDWVMAVVWCVESVLRQEVAPHKVNVAALGNMVPHLHWHIIPRWPDDPHFPDAIWAAPHRPLAPRPCVSGQLARYHARLAQQLDALAAESV